MTGRTVHMMALMADNGDVSPVCAETPRPINLNKATWTVRWDAVTCRKCLKLREKAA